MSDKMEFTALTERIRLRERCLGRARECSNMIKCDTL